MYLNLIQYSNSHLNTFHWNVGVPFFCCCRVSPSKPNGSMNNTVNNRKKKRENIKVASRFCFLFTRSCARDCVYICVFFSICTKTNLISLRVFCSLLFCLLQCGVCVFFPVSNVSHGLVDMQRVSEIIRLALNSTK